jgi:hypothetical protein
MARTSAEHKFLFISSILVFLLGVQTAASILDEPEESNRRAPAAIAAAKVALKSPTQAIPTAAQLVSLDVNCRREDKREVAVKGSLLQIYGKDCISEKTGEIKIVNRSNGYTASVFPRGNEGFQTDLIQLVEGQNEIVIEYKNPNGKKFERQVLVNSSHI